MPMDSSAPWRDIDTPANGSGEPAPDSSKRGGSRLLLVAAGVVVAVSVAAALFVASRPSGDLLVTPGATDSAAPGAPQTMLVVEVSGAVVHPGVYSLPAGSRVGDAIKAAGGYSPDVDPRQVEAQLNLAAKLQDAQLIRVPRRGDTASGAPGGGASSGTGGGALLNLNTATAAQLDTLPGIGPVTAEKIVASRNQQPFVKVDDLVTRKILSASALAKIRALITVG
jgi:competence protein ComEA